MNHFSPRCGLTSLAVIALLFCGTVNQLHAQDSKKESVAEQ